VVFVGELGKVLGEEKRVEDAVRACSRSCCWGLVYWFTTLPTTQSSSLRCFGVADWGAPVPLWDERAGRVVLEDANFGPEGKVEGS
jgi:hypothetical protein